MFTADLTDHLPLKSDCRASLWMLEGGKRVVFLYTGNALAEEVTLQPGEAPTAELLVSRCRPGQWALVSDWRPA
jgi:hypothetical protein